MVGTLPPSLVELRRTGRFAHPTVLAVRDDEDYSRGAISPEFLSEHRPPKNRGRRESRVLAAPAALRAKLKQAHKHSHYRFRRNDPTFPAQWLYGLLRDLPGGAGLLSPSPAGLLPPT